MAGRLVIVGGLFLAGTVAGWWHTRRLGLRTFIREARRGHAHVASPTIAERLWIVVYVVSLVGLATAVLQFLHSAH